jgi:hypothetical protein
MKFEFSHDDYSTYTFRAYETEYDPVDSSYDREVVRIYTLDTDTMTLAIREAEYAEPTVYLLDQDERKFPTHTQVFEYLFLMAFDQSRPPAESELSAVLKSQLGQAYLVGDTIEFPHGIQAHVTLTAVDGEAIVTYSRNGYAFRSTDVTYTGAPIVQNVWTTLFPERFQRDAAEEKALAIVELENEVRAARRTLELKDAELKRLQNG